MPGDLGRGQRPTPDDARLEGAGCRTFAGEPAAQKMHDRGWGRRGMRYPASEKLEIIRLVERSHLPVRRTLDKLGIPSTTFYRWYDRYQAFSEAGLEDRTSDPGRVWNRLPGDISVSRSWNWRWRHQAAIAPTSFTSLDCLATMARLTSLVISRNGSKTTG